MTQFIVSRKVVLFTEKELRAAGRKGDERFVLWCGTCEGDSFKVTTNYVPDQAAYRLKGGLCVVVEGSELFKLNQWLYEKGQILGAQIHAHAEDAYHSDTDDEYPIVTLLGGLSIVVPHFCAEGLLGRGTAIYRLTTHGWLKMTGPMRREIIKVVDDGTG
jgi:hypothetical protein